MADSLLGLIAQPKIVSPSEQFRAGKKSALATKILETTQLSADADEASKQSLTAAFGTPEYSTELQKYGIRKPEAATKIQALTEGIDEKDLSDAFRIFSTAKTMTNPDQRNELLETAKGKVVNNPMATYLIDTIQQMSPEQGDKVLGELISAGVQQKFLDAPKQTVDQIERELVVKEKKKTGTTLKLDKLINRRNELPEGSKERKLFEDAIAKEIKMPGAIKQRPHVAELMAAGWMPGTRITGPMLDSFEEAARVAKENGVPLTVEKLKTMEFDAVKNRRTGSTAGSRLPLARKQNVEAAQGLLKDLKATNAKLKMPTVKFFGMVKKWKDGQLNDPILVEYMTQRADSLFILGNALKQNGLTDKSIEVEEEAFHPTLAPKAFDSWLNTQIRALNRAAQEMNRDFGYGVSLLPSYPAGQGGAPTPQNPAPTLPSESHDQPTGQVLNFDAQGNLIQ